MRTVGIVLDPAWCLLLCQGHVRIHVGQIERRSRGPDGNWIFCIERKEPDPRLIVFDNISPHVEFKEAAQTRDRRASAGRDIRHQEGDDSDPGFALMGVEGQADRQVAGDKARFDLPVRKE